MAGVSFGPVKPVTQSDILKANENILASVQNDADDVLDSAHIGSRLNEWRRPVTEYGRNDAPWEVSIKGSQYIGDVDFGRREWARARDSVNEVLKLLMTEIKAYADLFEGLKIERYVRQGSARDGLKVIKPDEFDTLLQYHIEGIDIEPIEVRKNEKIIPEFCYIQVKRRSMEWLQTRFPKMHREGVFYQDRNGKIRLNAKMLHRAVFESIIDRAADTVQKKIREAGKIVFEIRRKINPPSINITLTLNDDAHRYFMPSGSLRGQQHVQEIDVDIVPGLLLRNDQVPDPSCAGRTMDCPVYAVFKWLEESSVKAAVFTNPEIVWRVCSSGYEKHTLDIARSDRRQRIIITALRILKTYFTKAKKSSQPPPPVTTVLRSYHLKHIAFYVILYLCHLHTDVRIDGIEDALVYFIAFLKISLEKKRLPHFFFSNRHIKVMYPAFPYSQNHLRFNLLHNKTDTALDQARLSLDRHLTSEIQFAEKGDGRVMINEKFEKVKGEYTREVTFGEFF